MKKLIWIPLILLLTVSCELFENNEKSYSLEEIETLEADIIRLSESVSCTNSSEWKFTPMGSKACGGPLRYIAYHVSVEEDFLALVGQFTKLQDEYNRKNNVVSDCMLALTPKSVTCEGGRPIFSY
jgi:hypothetical protein